MTVARTHGTKSRCLAVLAGSASLLSCASASPGPAMARLVTRPANRPNATASTPQRVVRDTTGRSYLKRATPDELKQFYAELAAQGWRNVQIVPICTGYSRTAGTVTPVGSHFATLYGDVDGDKDPEWVVGCHFPSNTIGELKPASEGPARPPMDSPGDRARIVVFKRNGNAWKISWISPGLGDEFRPLDFNLREVASDLESMSHLRIPLSLVDLDGSGHLSIAFQCWSKSPALGYLPGVYRWSGGRWMSVAPSADRFSLQDLNQDGKLELITGSRFIGYGRGDDDVPHVWRWNGRQYMEASTEFPHYFAQLADRYRKYVAQKERSGEAYDRAAWGRAIQKAASLAS